MKVEEEELRKLGFTVDLSGEIDRQWNQVDRADYVVAQSPHGVSALRDRGFPAQRIILLPLGVNTVRFHPERAGLPEKTFRALFVGNLIVRKGLHLLLETWQRLALDEAELVLVGKPVESVGEALLRRYTGAYRHAGMVDHARLAMLYREGDVFVFPSLSEGGALVVLEAMASGLPCIVSSGAPSVIRDGVEGFIVPVGDIDALKDRILRLYSDPELRRRMGAAARVRAEDFTWSDYRRRVAAMYRMLVTEPEPSGDVIDLSCR